MDYDFSKPGEYTVIGYQCLRYETPSCFKTNKIMITIE